MSAQRFIIPTLNAYYNFKSFSTKFSSDTTTNTYSKATSFTSLNDESKVYFLQESDEGKFEVYFGDGIVGKSLTDGNIIILEYVVTNKAGATVLIIYFIRNNRWIIRRIYFNVSNAQGGSGAQTKESIRFNAPLQYSAQDRAVTTSDYETKILELYPNAPGVSGLGW